MQVGEADDLGKMSGDNITFLFPDCYTAVVGAFARSQMYCGQVSFIQVKILFYII
jgi:hypothetical protein